MSRNLTRRLRGHQSQNCRGEFGVPRHPAIAQASLRGPSRTVSMCYTCAILWQHLPRDVGGLGPSAPATGGGTGALAHHLCSSLCAEIPCMLNFPPDCDPYERSVGRLSAPFKMPVLGYIQDYVEKRTRRAFQSICYDFHSTNNSKCIKAGQAGTPRQRQWAMLGLP